MTVRKKKICLLGLFGAGKTSLIRRFIHDTFEEEYLTTIGVNISQKRVATGRGTNYDFFIWDIEGHEKFSQAIDNYYTGAAGAVLTTDLTRPESLRQLSDILSRFQSINPNAETVLCATKSDLVSASDTSIEKSRDWANKNGLSYFVTSAKENSNVEKAFVSLAELL